MSLILLSLALLGLLLCGWLLWRQQAVPRAPARRQPPAPRVPVPAQAARPASAAAGAPAADPAQAPLPALPPEALSSFLWAEPAALADAQRQALQDAVRHIPRPPAALHQMLSPQFLERANSSELAELITGEARIAAKVLASVNAPFYGLKKPVSGIGQAVTFLGLNTVRSICMQSMLASAFKPANPALRQAHDTIWAASALASELCTRLSAKLGLADASALASQVLLSFLGHLATATLLSQHASGQAAVRTGGSLLDRIRSAQDVLGLGPTEIGGLVLRQWSLPEAIVAEVCAIDKLLVTAAADPPAARSQRLAVAHLCARLGEHLAIGGPLSGGALAGLAAGQAMADDGFYLRAHLAAPALARLPAHLQAADLVQALHRLQQGMQTRR
jgi:HD-like signal output (HDOD) protein